MSTVIITTINALLLGFIIRKRIILGYRAFVGQILKMLLAALIAFSVAFAFNLLLTKILAATFVMKIIKVSLVFFVSLIVYILFTYLFKVEYMQDVKEKLIAKFLKRKNNA